MNIKNPIIIDFPLRGEWIAVHTPGDKIPSHGTDALGQRFAYDFLRTDPNDHVQFFNGSKIKYYFIGINIEKCYSYQEKIFSPIDGIVIAAKDGIKEPKYLHPLIDLFKVILRSISVFFQSLLFPMHKINLHKFIGNYVIIEFDGKYAFFAHLSTGSIIVKEGRKINKGDLIGLVGHTGNSTAPHLHFHLMDSYDLLTAKGIPCSFTKCDVLINEKWISVENYIPKSNERIKI